MQYHIVFSFLLQPSKNTLQKLADLYLSLPQLCSSENIGEREEKSRQVEVAEFFSWTEMMQIFLRKDLHPYGFSYKLSYGKLVWFHQ